MVNILLCGCCGFMGRMICDCASSYEDINITAGVDLVDDGMRKFPVYKAIENVSVPVDVIIDFSHPSLLDGVLEYAEKHHVPAVLATTGLSEEQKRKIVKSSENVPLFFTANMSIGINVISELVKNAVSVLGLDYDIEIVEKHHRRKLDAPSGTALMLADAAASAREIPSEYIYDRHSVRKPRSVNDIGISAVRGGTIVGEHDVIFAGEDEVITISHSAGSRKVFAVGAIRAALFINGKDNGLYDMSALIKENMK
ncbi:MAG: 4-hydroxy-tetrahydrodipicolinate reductase [Clostridia bacterium]|nr:4-hydroxy-tetrahydrodipicolinate reductase [Clostridia bacterium]